MTRLSRFVALAFPPALPGAILATWWVGRVRLGHWPRPSLDDPRDLGAWVTFPHALTGLLLMFGLPLFLGAVAGLLWYAWKEPDRRGTHLRVVAVAVAACVGAVLFMRWDPWGAVDWYLD